MGNRGSGCVVRPHGERAGFGGLGRRRGRADCRCLTHGKMRAAAGSFTVLAVGRMDSDRATDVMDAIVNAGWRLSLEDRLIRKYAIVTGVLLALIAVLTGFLVDGAPVVGLVAGLLAPLCAAVLIAVGFRAIVLDLTGDRHRADADVRDLLRVAVSRALELLYASLRAVRHPEGRAPLAAPIIVVNGISAEEAARTSRALVAHRWGEDTKITSGLLFGGLFVLPVAVIDTLIVVAWQRLSYARLPALAVGVGLTIFGLVVALALDAGMRGALLRAARGDESALPPDVCRLVVLQGRTARTLARAYGQAIAFIIVATGAVVLLAREPGLWFVVFAITAAVAAIVMLQRAYRRPTAGRS